jgi:hypothetical protein
MIFYKYIIYNIRMANIPCPIAESELQFLPGQERVVFSPSRSERNDPAHPSMFKMVLPSLGQDGQMSYSIDWSNRPPKLFPYSCEPNDDWVIGTIATLREERELPELPDSILWRANLVPYRQGGHARAPPMQWDDDDDDDDGGIAAMDQRLAREDAEQRRREQLVNEAELEAMHAGQGWNQPRGLQAAQPVHGGNDWFREQILRPNPQAVHLDALLANIDANRRRLQPPPGYPIDDYPGDDGRIDEQDEPYGGGGRTHTKKSKKRRPTRRIRHRHRRGSSKRKVRKSSRKSRATRRK